MSLRVACGCTLSTALAIAARTDTGAKLSPIFPSGTETARSQPWIILSRSAIRVLRRSKRPFCDSLSTDSSSAVSTNRFCWTALRGERSSWETIAAKFCCSISFSRRSAMASRTSRLRSRPRWAIRRSSSGVNGLGRKSNAPFFIASTADSTVE